MKILSSFLIFILFFIQHTAQAQTPLLKEWFSQKKTQKEYLVKQIAALETYLKFARNGYKIYKTGLTSIGNFKNGEFMLHEDFFNSLKIINPSISEYPRVKDIIRNVDKIAIIHRGIKDIVTSSKSFKVNEKQLLLEKFTRMSNEAASLLNDLTIVVDPGALEMKDDERIQRIDKIHQNVLILYQRVSQLNQEVLIIQKGRMMNKLDVQTMKNLIKP